MGESLLKKKINDKIQSYRNLNVNNLLMVLLWSCYVNISNFVYFLTKNNTQYSM